MFKCYVIYYCILSFYLFLYFSYILFSLDLLLAQIFLRLFLFHYYYVNLFIELTIEAEIVWDQMRYNNGKVDGLPNQQSGEGCDNTEVDNNVLQTNQKAPL
jgi:hypothetical protein